MSKRKSEDFKKLIERVNHEFAPKLDIGGVAGRNAESFQMVNQMRISLEAFSHDQSEILEEISNTLTDIPRSLYHLRIQDNKTSTLLARLIISLEETLEKTTDPTKKKELKRHMDEIRNQGSEYATPREKPRNLKEALAKKYMGLHPQDVRKDGLLLAFDNALKKDVRSLFGDNLKGVDSFQQIINDERSVLKNKRKMEELQRGTTSLVEKLPTTSAVSDMDIKMAEKELALRDKKREEKTEHGKIDVSAQTKNPKKYNDGINLRSTIEKNISATHEVSKWVAIIASQITDLNKKIEGGVGGGYDVTPIRTKRRKKHHFEEMGEIEKDHEMALMYDVVFDKMKNKGHFMTSEEQHEQALRTNGNIDRKNKEKGYVDDKLTAHAEALEEEKEKTHERALRTNTNIDRQTAHAIALEVNANIERKMKERQYIHDKVAAHEQAALVDANINKKHQEMGYVHDKDEAHDQALRVNENIDNKTAQTQTPTIAESPTSFIEDEKEDDAEKGGSFVGDVLGGIGSLGLGAAGIGSLGLGAAGLGLAGVGSWKIGGWMNKKLGLQSSGERAMEGVNKLDEGRKKTSESMAKDRGYSSFRQMREANKSKAQQKADLGVVEKTSIEDRIKETEKPFNESPTQIVNNYNSQSTTPSKAPSPPAYIRPVHPSLMRFQEKRMSRILNPQTSV